MSRAGKLQRIREAIADRVVQVPEIGVVHLYERYAKQQQHFAELYFQDGAIRGCYIRRAEKQEHYGHSGRTTIDNVWHIVCRRALVDSKASELQFDAAIETVIDRLAADNTLGGEIFDLVIDKIGLGVTDVTPVMFAGVLCHSATLVFMTRHFSD